MKQSILSFEIWFIPPVVDNWLLEEIKTSSKAEAREEVNQQTGKPKSPIWLCFWCDEDSALKEQRRLLEKKQSDDIEQRLLNRKKELLKEEEKLEIPYFCYTVETYTTLKI